MSSGYPGSSYEPRTIGTRRLARWKQMSWLGYTTAEIADDLGMTKTALDRFLVRARKAGHPDAVHHPRFLAMQDSLRHLVSSEARTRRRQRQRARG